MSDLHEPPCIHAKVADPGYQRRIVLPALVIVILGEGRIDDSVGFPA